jgi:hypothetical protein
VKDSTPYFRRLADCVGKEPFATPQLAAKVMRRRAAKPKGRARTRKVYHGNAQVYHCPHCSMFHIGTKAKSVHASPKRARRPIEGDDADMA